MAFRIDLGSLSVTIGADTDGFEKGKETVSKGLKEVSRDLRASVNKWGKWAAAASVAAATVATAVIKSNLTAIRELKNLARAANTNTAEFQRGAFAAQQFGIEQEKYGDILKDVTDRIGDFITTGGGPMLDFFEQVAPKIGVTIDQFKRLSGQEALGLYIESLQKANLTQAEMTFFMEAIASDSTRLIPLFQNNSKEMRKMTAEAKALGIGLSEIDVAQAIAAQRELEKMAFVLDADLKQAVANLAPFITAAVKEINKMTEGVGGFAEVAIPAFELVGKSIALVGNTIQVIKIAIKGLELIALGVTSAIALAFNGLAQVVTGIGNTILEGWKLIFIEMGKLVGNLSANAKKIFDDIASGIDSIKGKVPKIIGDMAKAQVAALEIARDELQTLALEEIPTQKFEKFIANVKQAALDAAPEILASLTGQGTGVITGAGTGVDTGEKKEADRIREENKSILEALLEESSLREETLLGRIERERDIVEQARNNELISKEEHQRAMNEIDRREANVKMSIITSSLDAAIQALNIGGKKATKAQRALAITNAIIKGKGAAVDAWQAGMSTGGPWAPLVAAAYTAASIARTAGMIRSIRGGGSSSGGSGGGVTIPSQSRGTSGQTGQTGGGTANQASRQIDVRFFGSGNLPMEQVRELIEQFNEALGDGAQLNVVGG